MSDPWQDEFDKMFAWNRWAFPLGMAVAYISVALALVVVTVIWGKP